MRRADRPIPPVVSPLVRLLIRLALVAALLGWVAVRIAAVHTTAFNWDELVLLHEVARSASEGVLRSSGHPGLPQALLIPWVEGCEDEIALGRAVRLAWLALTWTALAGVFVLLLQLLPAGPQRRHDAALGTALLGLAPVFLEWSIQVRTDQWALCGGAWGAAALLASRRRPWLAALAGLALGVGWLGTEKLAYLAALAALLAAGDLWLRGEWSPRREALRVALVAVAGTAVLVGWRTYVRANFDVPDFHGAVSVAAPETLASRFDSFRFYRGTIGYSQYWDALPELVPQLALLAAAIAAALLCPAARTRRLGLAAAAALLGVAVGAFHAGAFAYFLMTLGVFAAAALTLALPSLRRFAERWAGSEAMATAVVWSALALFAGLHAVGSLRDTQAVQRESLAFVSRNFPPESAGFHPEAGSFCSTRQPLGVWLSHRIYRNFGRGEAPEAAAAQLLERFRGEPVLYLVHSFRLNQFPVSVRRFWEAHYLPYRASVFVAGRRLAADDPASLDFELLASARYRWLPRGVPQPVEIDGRRLEPGAVAALEAGRHRARFADAEARGSLVLAVAEPPGQAPQPFYKRY